MPDSDSQRRGFSHRPDSGKRPSNTRNDSHRGGPHGSPVALEAISAPYNFVPLANWVHIPDWGAQVSHDLPFRNGCSGEIAYRLIAESPLLVGGKQEKPHDGAPGEIRPFKLPDGRHAVPGSSLKGLLRSTLEIAGFGRMRSVDNVRPGLRDISCRSVSQSYAEKVRNRVQTGFLRRRKDGSQAIVPCKMVRLDHRDLEAALGVSAPIFPAQKKSVKEKYELWREACKRKGWDPKQLSFSAVEGEAKQLGRGSLTGAPVFTGQISDSTKPKGKRRDFVFYAPDTTKTLPVADDVWRDFLRIHGGEDGKSAMSWPGHWEEEFRRGAPVPVFYVQDAALLRFGLAYMPKLAGDFSIHDMIRHSSPAHLQEPGLENGYDLADLLFGAINDKRQNDALRGRISCDTAVAASALTFETHEPAILNGPKPTYFPNYITQQTNPENGKLLSGQYATYLQTGQFKAPTLRGFKRYPVRPDSVVGVQKLTEEQKKSTNVQVRLHTLPKGSTLDGRIVFHNLRPEELGALLWSLTWGENPHLRHSLGMGKPFGFGQVRFELLHDKSRLLPNDPTLGTSLLDRARAHDFVQTFQAHMEAACVAARQAGGWKESPQMANLLAMADPAAAKKLPRGMELRHMRLDSRLRVNEFSDAKKAALALADYAKATKDKG